MNLGDKKENFVFTISEKSNNLDSVLDTLAQLHPPPPEKPYFSGDNGDLNSFSKNETPLFKRARAKYMTNAYVLPMCDQLNSKLEKNYRNSYYCASTLIGYGDKLQGKFCKTRWCLACNRIRTAKLITSYKSILSSWSDAYFVTLTVPNCSGFALRETIEKMISEFQAIKDSLYKKKKVKLVGIRKLECTYNALTDSYHPHFHFLFEQKAHAEHVLGAWLRRNPSCKFEAQNCKKADDDSIKELFKYFTKVFTTRATKTRRRGIYITALDNIFVAMVGLQVYRNFGFKKNPDEFESDSDFSGGGMADMWVWMSKEHDWINPITKECLTGYKPNEELQNLYKLILK
jgi:hypothetical protein